VLSKQNNDELGRHELSRLLYGGRVTLLVGFAATDCATHSILA
jgi:ABC-type dipeptide/oligopeptide/nickel transport system permease subunit